MYNKFNCKTIILSLMACGVLAGCATNIEKTNKKLVDDSTKEVARVKTKISNTQDSATIRGGAQYAEQRSKEQMVPVYLRTTRKAWIGSSTTPINEEDKLPAIFRENFTFNFSDGGRPISLGVMASRLSTITGMPVRVEPDVYKSESANEAPSTAGVGAIPKPPIIAGDSTMKNFEMPADRLRKSSAAVPLTQAASISVDSIQMSWDGSLADFLDNVTDRLGLSWELRDNTIVISKYITRFYELSTFKSDYTYELNSGSTGQGSGSGVSQSSSLLVKEKGELDAYKKIIAIIQELIKPVPGSQVLTSDGSGQVMVKTSKEVQAQIRSYIKKENSLMMRQCQIQMDIYSVRTTGNNEFGVDMSALYTAVTGKQQGALTSPATLTGALAGALTFKFYENPDAIIPKTDPNTGETLPTTNRRTNTAIINALSEMGDSVQYRPISMVAMNHQWARKNKLNTISYLSKTTPSAGGGLTGGSGLPGLETSQFVTGDQFMAMPYILDNNDVILKFGLSLSDLIALVDQTTGTGATLQKVQTPNISSVTDQFTVALHPGEVMAITGLSRDVNEDTTRRLGENAPIWAGGSNKRTATKENFVVFIRAVVM